MTHPYGRSKRRPRDARADPKRYRLTPIGNAWLERLLALDPAATDTDWREKNRRALAQLRALNNAILAAGLYRPANPNAGEATGSNEHANQAPLRPLPPLHK